MIQELTKNNLPSNISKYMEERLARTTLGALSHTYIFTIENLFIGYCILDFEKGNIDRGLSLYEIMIDPDKRRVGYGSKLLKEIIDLTKRLSFYSIVCKPCPIEEFVDKDDYRMKQEKIRQWYIKNGFKKYKNDDYIYKI